MTKKLDLYRCNICNNIIEVLNAGEGELVCCGSPMEHILADKNENENLNDKHVPVIEKVIDGYKIRIGSNIHPVIIEHHIQFIQAISKDEKHVKTKFLTIDDLPELNIKCKCESSLWARALCNIHGLFKNEFLE